MEESNAAAEEVSKGSVYVEEEEDANGSPASTELVAETEGVAAPGGPGLASEKELRLSSAAGGSEKEYLGLSDTPVDTRPPLPEGAKLSKSANPVWQIELAMVLAALESAVKLALFAPPAKSPPESLEKASKGLTLTEELPEKSPPNTSSAGPSSKSSAESDMILGPAFTGRNEGMSADSKSAKLASKLILLLPLLLLLMPLLLLAPAVTPPVAGTAPPRFSARRLAATEFGSMPPGVFRTGAAVGCKARCHKD